MQRPVLVAPGPFAGLRATEVAAALGRGLEGGGLAPPDLCPVAEAEGVVEVLITALGGETHGRVALIEDGQTALVDDPAVVAAATELGAGVVVVAPGEAPPPPLASGPRIVALCTRQTPREAWAAAGAILEPAAAWVLDALGFDARMRGARCVVLGAGRIDETTLRETIFFEMATRARQGGVPAHAVVGEDALDLFGKRIIDLQHVLEATTPQELAAAGEELARRL